MARTPDPDYAQPELTEAQANAASTLREAAAAGGFSVHLLDGVTGSGKTEVYFEAVAEAIRRGRQALILLPEIALTARFLDRFFDLRIMDRMQVSVANALRPEEHRDPYGVERSLEQLRKGYDWLEANLGDGPWAIGDTFTMADCAAAPSLFYADWVDEIGPTRPRLQAYRARLLAHPAVVRAVEGARPYRAYFPLGAPDRD